MHPTTSTHLLAVLATLMTTAAALVHEVKVGQDGLVYDPSSLTAAKGDTVVFQFYAGDHNVVEGDFATPCATTGGFYSGFIDSSSGGPASETFTITIDSTDPIFIYCSQDDHCQQGMAMAINAPSSGNTLSAYIKGAAKTSISTTPANVGGGVISSSGGSGSGSSSSSSSSSPSPSSSQPSSSSSGSGSGSGSSSASTASGGSSTGGSSTPSSTPAASATSATGGTTTSPSPTSNAAAGGFGGESVVGVLAVLALWAGVF